MPLFLLGPILTVICIVHVVRTGRDTIWIYVLIILQVIGPIAYFFAEILPDLLGSRQSRALAAGAVKTLDPGRSIRHRTNALDLTDTVENRRLLAEEYCRAGRFEEAIQLYESTLVGLHADDPVLMLGLARAAAGRGDAALALATLDQLRAAHPDAPSTEASFIRARSLEALGREIEALNAYTSLAGYAPGEEARCQQAILLHRQSDIAAAQAVFGEILRRSRHADKRYLRSEKQWIDIARRAATG